MTKTIFTIFSVFALIILPSFAVFAALDEAVVQDEKSDGGAETLLEAKNRTAKEANDLLIEIFSSLDVSEKRHYSQMQYSYNLVETIKIVQGDVSHAVDGCGQNNPEMKDEMDQRLALWNTAIDPVMAEAEGHFQNMRLVQDYADPVMLGELFALLDQTRKYTKEHINKIPVTTKGACEYLLGKMDETQVSLISRLNSTLISVPDFSGEAEESVTGASEDDVSDL